MKATILAMALLFALSLMFIFTFSLAQAGDDKPALNLAGSRPRMEPQMPISPCYCCVERDNPVSWKWHVQNRLSDLDLITRSNLNPDSDLDYMMRTY